jgi:hypothetical protein
MKISEAFTTIKDKQGSIELDQDLWYVLNGHNLPGPGWAAEQYYTELADGDNNTRLTTNVNQAMFFMDELLPGNKVTINRTTEGVRVKIQCAFKHNEMTAEMKDSFPRDELAVAIIQTTLVLTGMMERKFKLEEGTLQHLMKEEQSKPVSEGVLFRLG